MYAKHENKSHLKQIILNHIYLQSNSAKMCKYFTFIKNMTSYITELYNAKSNFKLFFYKYFSTCKLLF